ncbi:FadR/GntR family transcriptional regulator [Burkholderia multivorans]|uniref:FadR/GntR family transcriptional regulator n=1 Tax=Burkholderia multivorans TaxID=87883 RepID=UPI0019D2A812|nr:FadR/GntR family transcriptional regulator [Burkholderia multivorans]MBN7129776.1 FadR family transcriptional regulator [Burkholderia multivorans]QSL25742.1 FadR family transcriptional regulator [Burkholderia multivorans]
METLHRQVLNQMGEQICSGHFAPGDILPAEPILAEQMQVSRITIRETMKSLAAKGMLQVRRRYGTIVLPRSQWQLFDPDVITWRARAGSMDEGLIADLMELRLIIEPNAAKLAAKRATAEDRAAVRRAYKAMERAVAGHGDYVPADLAFHGAILTACHNQFVQQMQNALSAILQTSFELSSEIEGGPARSLPMHEALCIAIEQGDQAAAEEAVLTLIRRAEKDFEDRARLLNTANQQAI